MAGSGGNNDGWWDGANLALMSSGTLTSFGPPTTVVVSALKVTSPNDFIAFDNGFSGAASDCYQDLLQHKVLSKHFDTAKGGNIVQCGEIGGVGTDTTFTVALGYGSDAESALAAANESLTAGFIDRETAYSGGWNGYVNGLNPAPASVSPDPQRRRTYYVAAMALHAAEDKTFRGASVAGFATPWGDFADGTNVNDGYHRVWGRDLYQQATGLIAAGDFAQARRMAQFMWNRQFIGSDTPGANTIYPPGSFPRYSPVSGIGEAPPGELGCCEQLDQAGFAILLAWMTGLTDAATYEKIKLAANHLQAVGPATTERWEEQFGKSPSSIGAEIAGLVAAADIARQNGDSVSAGNWESTADLWRASLNSWTVTSSGFWRGQHYYERIDESKTSDPNDPSDKLCFQEGCFFAHDIADFGFLELVRLGVSLPNDTNVLMSISPAASASDGNSNIQVTTPNGDIYFHRYNHDNYGESNNDCSGWPALAAGRFGRLWPVLSGERGEYEVANGRSGAVYLQSMADSTNDGYFIPEQIWDNPNVSCFEFGRPTGSAAPLNWAEGQYLRLSQSIDAGYNLETPSVVKAKYRGSGPIRGNGGKCIDAGASTNGTAAIEISKCSGATAQSWTWNSGEGTLRVFDKCMDATGGSSANGTRIQLSDCNGTGAQEWRWRKQNRLENPQSGRCLDVAAGETGDGTQLRLWDCNDTASQAWYLP